MLEYFEDQLNKCPPFSHLDAVKMVESRIKNGYGEATDLTEMANSKIGQRFAFYMLSTNDSEDPYDKDRIKLKVVKSFEDDIETDLKNAKFIGFSGNIPKFEML